MIRMDKTDLIAEGLAYTDSSGSYEGDLIGWLTEALQAATEQAETDVAAAKAEALAVLDPYEDHTLGQRIINTRRVLEGRA